MAKIEVWDGKSPSRHDLSNVKNPDHQDYLTLVAKVQQLQVALNNASGNLALLPSVHELFLEVERRIEDFKQQIAELTLPTDLQERIFEIEKQLVKQDTRKETNVLRRDLEAVRSQMDKNQLHVLELQGSFSTEVTAFQSKVWNTLKTLDREIRERLEAVEKRLDSVAIQTRIQSLLEELNK